MRRRVYAYGFTGTLSRMETRARAGFPRLIESTVRRRRADVVAVACSLVVLAISIGLLGRLDRVPEFERDVFRAINGLPSSQPARHPVGTRIIATHLGKEMPR